MLAWFYASRSPFQKLLRLPKLLVTDSRLAARYRGRVASIHELPRARLLGSPYAAFANRYALGPGLSAATHPCRAGPFTQLAPRLDGYAVCHSIPNNSRLS